MLFIGLLCSFIGANLYSAGRKLGLSPSTAEQLPNYSFFFGLVLGLGIRTIQAVKYAFTCVAAMAVVGAVFWFFGAVVEALAVHYGLNPDQASWISPGAFWLGFLLGSFTLYSYFRRVAGSRFERWKSARPTWTKES